ncbi:MAG TPA: hypothetical protein VMP03_00470 [Methylomirabilota bacterium]|nr:hypothetical protein [Methylomirabilota bacterium]
MVDRIMTYVAFAVFCGFLGILVWNVPLLDLGVVVLLTILLAAYDLFVHRSKPGAPSPSD